ncbi:MAG: zinc transporter ZupT [Spirochaetia bacterium]
MLDKSLSHCYDWGQSLKKRYHMFYAVLATLFAGLATLVGGLIGIFYRKGDHKWLSIALGFSAGVMIYLSFVELFFNAQDSLTEYYGEKEGAFRTLLTFMTGMIIVVIIDRLLPDLHGPDVRRNEHSGKLDPSLARTLTLWRTGMMTTIIIGMHNLPEGIITFLTTLKTPEIGMIIAIAIAIHNIPEGLAVYIPVYEATDSRKKALWMTFLSGMTEPFGALIAYLLLAPYLTPILLQHINVAIAGIMVYISLDELLPTAKEYGHYHLAMLGLCVGMFVMGFSLVLLS